MTIQTDAELTGSAFDLVNAGYAEMPDLERESEHQSIDSDSASLRDAAERISTYLVWQFVVNVCFGLLFGIADRGR